MARLSWLMADYRLVPRLFACTKKNTNDVVTGLSVKASQDNCEQSAPFNLCELYSGDRICIQTLLMLPFDEWSLLFVEQHDLIVLNFILQHLCRILRGNRLRLTSALSVCIFMILFLLITSIAFSSVVTKHQWSWLVDWVKHLWSWLVGWVNHQWSWLVDWVKHLWSWLVGWVYHQWSWLVDLVKHLWSWLVGWVNHQWSWLVGWVNHCLSSVSCYLHCFFSLLSLILMKLDIVDMRATG